MEFTFTDEQKMIAQSARDFFNDHATSARTRAAMAGDGIDRDLWASFCQQLGFSGISIAEKVGGSGLGFVELAIVAEAAGAQIAALPMLGSLGQAAQAIAAGGSEQQQESWLPRLLSGDLIAAYVDGAILTNGKLNGGSSFVAHGASAELLIVDDGHSSWIVPSTASGVTITALTTMDQSRPLARVELDQVEGEALERSDVARAASNKAGWMIAAAEALGGAQQCLDLTVAYSKDRVQFGRPIGSFQAYKHRLADMMIEIEQARSAVYWAACSADENADNQMLALHAAKSFAADTFLRCAGDMIQLHGGIGFTWEHDAHLYFKRARALQSMLGSGAWHREQIATLMLGEAA